MSKRLEVNPGDKYGRMTILREVEPSGEKRRVLCRCECGTKKVVQLGHLRSGATKSCGCLNLELVTTHGLRQHPLYAVWDSMKSRCENSKYNRYSRYGGRGVKICQEWRDSGTFMKWALANGWKPGLQIDRIDNDGDYEPDNCRFVTRTENIRNSTVAKLTTKIVAEIRMWLSLRYSNTDIAEAYGVGQTAIRDIKTGRTWK